MTSLIEQKVADADVDTTMQLQVLQLLASDDVREDLKSLMQDLLQSDEFPQKPKRDSSCNCIPARSKTCLEPMAQLTRSPQPPPPLVRRALLIVFHSILKIVLPATFKSCARASASPPPPPSLPLQHPWTSIPINDDTPASCKIYWESMLHINAEDVTFVHPISVEFQEVSTLGPWQSGSQAALRHRWEPRSPGCGHPTRMWWRQCKQSLEPLPNPHFHSGDLSH